MNEDDGGWGSIGHRLLSYQPSGDKESKGEMSTMVNMEIRQVGPASKVIPNMEVAFVRRKGKYGMRWPGAPFSSSIPRSVHWCESETSPKNNPLLLTLHNIQGELICAKKLRYT